jgi:hypothetical protein
MINNTREKTHCFSLFFIFVLCFFSCIVYHCPLFLSCVFSRVLFIIVSYFYHVFFHVYCCLLLSLIFAMCFFTCIIVYQCLLFLPCVFSRVLFIIVSYFSMCFFTCIVYHCLLFFYVFFHVYCLSLSLW